MARGRRADRGFTLIEVVVAFVVLALSLGALFEIFATGLRSAGAAGDYAVAAMVAESRLDALDVETPLEAGEYGGPLDGGFRWRAEARPYPLDETPGVPYPLVEVVLTVSWHDGGRERSVTVTTLRPAAAE